MADDDPPIEPEDELPPDEEETPPDEEETPPDGSEDEDIEARPDDDDPDEPEERQPDRQPSRGSRQFGELRRENRELRERVERMERDRGGNQGGLSEAERLRQEEAERTRLAMMTPEEQLAHYRQRDRAEFGQALNQMERRAMGREDKRDFDHFLERNPQLRKYEAETERRFDEAFQRGGFASRRDIVQWLIGRAVIEKGGRAVGQQRRQAAARQDRQRTEAPASGSDRPRQTGRQPKTARERLEGVTF